MSPSRHLILNGKADGYSHRSAILAINPSSCETYCSMPLAVSRKLAYSRPRPSLVPVNNV
jgi:hypothetical protein